MRERVDRARLHAFMRALAEAARRPLQVNLVGGATAVLEGWRDATIDVDLAVGGDAADVLRALPAIKQSDLHRFPAIDPPSFRRAVEAVTSGRLRGAGA